jgi:hypothetical protein
MRWMVSPISGPTEIGSVTLATFNDTCGNLIGLFQPR